jgi:hypothetical protein
MEFDLGGEVVESTHGLLTTLAFQQGQGAFL